MPPNRKTNYDGVAQALQGRFVAAAPKHHDNKSSPPPQSERERTIASILEQDRIRQLLSSDHLQANLIKDSQRRTTQQSGKKKAPSSNDDSDEYWAMPGVIVTTETSQGVNTGAVTEYPCSQPVLGTVQPPEESEKRQIIQQILEAERVRQLFQADHVEKRLVEQAALLTTTASSLKPEHDAYWAM